MIGRERALYLIGQLPRCITRDKRYPGATASHVMLYVPTVQRLQLDHDLVRILGYSDAVKLCKVFGGEILQPASCADIYRRYRDSMIAKLLFAEGMSIQHVAAIVGVSDRHVRSIRAEIPQEALPVPANDNAPVTKRMRKNGKPRVHAVVHR